MLILEDFIEECGIFLRDVGAASCTVTPASHLVRHAAPRHLVAVRTESGVLVLVCEVLFVRDRHRAVLGVDGLGGFYLVT